MRKEIPPFNFKGVDGTVIGDEIRDQLTPRSFGKTIVAATSKIGMFGAKFNTDAPGRQNVHVHPYPWTAAGSTIVPILRDQNALMHVALVHNIRLDRNKKIYRLPEGYMHPKGCPEFSGGLPTVFQPNDAAEVKIAFQGVNHVDAYAQHPPVIAEESDQDLIATALREANEEISFQLQRNQLTYLGQNEENGKIHSIANYYFADLNYPGKIFSEPPKLISSDLDEIGEIRWIQTKDIVQVDNKFFIDDFEIPAKYAVMIGHAILEARRQALCKTAQKNIASTDDLYDLINPFLLDFNLEEVVKPKGKTNYFNELGNEAELRHGQFMILAKLYDERIRGRKAPAISLITRAELEAVVSTVPEEQRSFSMAMS